MLFNLVGEASAWRIAGALTSNTAGQLDDNADLLGTGNPAPAANTSKTSTFKARCITNL
jgi:hypothetical protein